MRTRRTGVELSVAIMAVLAIPVLADGRVSSCCSTDSETALILSEFNFREVSISNAIEFLCEQTEKELGVKLKMDFGANPPEVHITIPSGLGNDEQRVTQELRKQVEEQVADRYIPPKLWGERKITFSLRNVPVCEALKYILELSLSGAEIPCQRQGRDFLLGPPQVWRVGRMYRIRPEAWNELQRTSELERQRTEAARRGVFFDFAAMFFPAHVCLPERRLVVAAGTDRNHADFKKELMDQGWLESADDH